MDRRPAMLLGVLAVTVALLLRHVSVLHLTLLVMLLLCSLCLTAGLVLELLSRRPLASDRWRHYLDELHLLAHHALPDQVPAPRLPRTQRPSPPEPEPCTDALQAELIGLVGDVERQCVFSWYCGISRESSFPRRAKSLLDEAVYELAGRAASLCPRRLLIRLARLLHLHVRQYRRAAAAAARAGSGSVERHYRYRHPASGGGLSEGAYLTAVTTRLLSELAPARLRLAGSPELALTRLLARSILGEILDRVSRPANLIRWILEAVQEQERSELDGGPRGEPLPQQQPSARPPPLPSESQPVKTAQAAVVNYVSVVQMRVVDEASQTQDEYIVSPSSAVSARSAVYVLSLWRPAPTADATSQTHRSRDRRTARSGAPAVRDTPSVPACGPFAKLWRPPGRLSGARARFPFGGDDVQTGLTEQEYRHRLEEQRQRARVRARRRRRRLQPRRSSSAGDLTSLDEPSLPPPAPSGRATPAAVSVAASRSECNLHALDNGVDVVNEERTLKRGLIREEAVRRDPLNRADEMEDSASLGRLPPPPSASSKVSFSLGPAGAANDDSLSPGFGAGVPPVLFSSKSSRQEPLLDSMTSVENPRCAVSTGELGVPTRSSGMARSASSESIPHRARAKFQSLLQSAAQGIANKASTADRARSSTSRQPPVENHTLTAAEASSSNPNSTCDRVTDPDATPGRPIAPAPTASSVGASSLSTSAPTEPVAPLQASPLNSPEYEEAADFADTIARLRAVLQARGPASGSQSSGTDTPSCASCPPALPTAAPPVEEPAPVTSAAAAATCSPATAASGGGGADTVRSVIDGVRQRLFQRDSSSASSTGSPGGPRSLESLGHRDSAASLYSNKSDRELELASFPEEILEAAELPMDGRIFVNVVISGTETQRERGGGEYTLYTVQYDGLYLAAAEGQESDSAEPSMVLKTNVVRRRFREFLNLHSRLEASSEYRHLLKGVKEPSRWQTLPFNRLDSAAIVSRRTFLERYLGQLCARPHLSTSDELKEFMAYETDGSIAFIRKPVISVPRIDQMFTKTMSGVLKTIRTALPSFESSEAQRKTSDERRPLSLNYKYNVHVMCGTDEQMSPVELRLKELIVEWDSLSAVPLQRRGSVACVPTTDQADSDVSSDDEAAQYERHLPLASALLDLCAETLRPARHWAARAVAVRAAKLLLGRLIEGSLQRSVERAVRPAACVDYLRILRQTLFSGEPEPEPSASLPQLRARLIAAIARLNGGACLVLGRPTVELMATSLLDSLQSARINRDLALQLLDCLLVDLVPGFTDGQT